MPQTILYYPTIDIQDGAWLRNAVLYWDKVASIVPYASYEDFSPELQYLWEHEMYEPIYPQELFYSEYAEEFSNTIVRRLKIYSARQQCERQGPKNENIVRIHRDKIYAPALHELIHYQKLPKNLLEYFTSNDYIDDYNCDGWMSIDSHVASVYMRTLAEYSVKCHSNDIVIGTDSRKNQDSFFHFTRRAPTSACVSIELNNCLPQVAMDVSYENLIDFKLHHQAELLEFRQRLRDYEVALSQCDSPEQIRFCTEQFKEAWQLELQQFQKVAKSGKISFRMGSLIALVGVPAVADYFINRPNTPTIASAAIMGGIAGITICEKYIDYRNKINERRSSAGFSYLIKAQKNGMIDFN